ncbi:ThiF family adenylyltransferase [Mycobacteroides franklinii]|uniref:ThiF family adenylyltransferase n=1 Tax=Mycobacteroides franklinii TaxID=948102 RepID=UPI0013E8CE0C
MTRWEDAIEATTADFIEQLEQRGFLADGRHLNGELQVDSSAVGIQIEIPDSFPFVPPVVWPPSDLPRSWHRELTGAMCLYSADGRENLPWLDPDDFLAASARWLRESFTGWTDDFPDLDLERYFARADEPLVTYGELDGLSSQFVQLRREKNCTRMLGAGSLPRRAKGIKKGRAFGYVAAIGEPAVPPTTWDEIKPMLPVQDAHAIEMAVRDGRLSYLIVRYSRGGVDAAVALRIWRAKSDAIQLAAVRSACDAPSVLALRSGPSSTHLADASVVVVGVGAIGSFLCDLLARAGVGTITLYDPDIVRPGNLIRHFAGADFVGLSKAQAVKQAVESRPFNSSVVVAISEPVPSPREVMSLFTESALVIDASAAGGTTDMLGKAAAAGGHHLLSVCIQEEGAVARVDIIPPLNADPLPPNVSGPPIARQNLKFEAGCGDPVSQTPAFAVLEAAALAARCAIGMLTGAPICSAGIIHDYR